MPRHTIAAFGLLVVLLSSRVALACGFGSGQIQINWDAESQSRAAVPASR